MALELLMRTPVCGVIINELRGHHTVVLMLYYLFFSYDTGRTASVTAIKVSIIAKIQDSKYHKNRSFLQVAAKLRLEMIIDYPCKLLERICSYHAVRIFHM